MHKLRNPDKDGSHHYNLGKIYREAFQIKETSETHSIIHFECLLNPLGKNVYYLSADFRSVLAEYWDALVFSMFREYYGFSYPKLFGATYMDFGLTYPIIFKKEEEEVSITYNDWRKRDGRNFKTRFHLACLVYFCKFMGVPLTMNMIKIKNGVPYLWDVGMIGFKHSKTLQKNELLELFDIHTSDWTLLMEGRPPPSLMCSNFGGLGYQCHKKLEMKENSMVYMVIEYMRSIDFNLDVFRSFIHLRENEIRYHATNRQTHPTRIKPRIITSLLESNQACLVSNSPMDIFIDKNY